MPDQHDLLPRGATRDHIAHMRPVHADEEVERVEIAGPKRPRAPVGRIAGRPKRRGRPRIRRLALVPAAGARRVDPHVAEQPLARGDRSEDVLRSRATTDVPGADEDDV